MSILDKDDDAEVTSVNSARNSENGLVSVGDIVHCTDPEALPDVFKISKINNLKVRIDMDGDPSAIECNHFYDENDKIIFHHDIETIDFDSLDKNTIRMIEYHNAKIKSLRSL